MIAVGVSSLAKQKIQGFDFDIAWAGFDEQPLDLIRENDNDFALVDLNEVDADSLALRTDLRAVMRYWPDEQSTAGTNAGYLLVVKPSVEAKFVRELVSAIDADSIILKASSIDTTKLDPSMTMVDLPLELHQGLQSYVKTAASSVAAKAAPSETRSSDANRAASASAEVQEATPSVIPIAVKPDQTPIPKAAAGSRSYTVYFGSNEAELDGGDMRSVAKACQYASRLPRVKFIISGHTDTVGSPSANKKLAALRAAEVADAIRNDPRYRDALSVVEFGESVPAIETGDEVGESLNRRVLITIVPEE